MELRIKSKKLFCSGLRVALTNDDVSAVASVSSSFICWGKKNWSTAVSGSSVRELCGSGRP
ncbi:unnamed protein product [Meloidogyne enterolobii]|uniref:Uncharacterized protein n=1 Tax=Meloidogyne enterolobii TaxID=390850 RepID=A0ACB0Y8W9_MELEN